jgi:MFS family permease
VVWLLGLASLFNDVSSEAIFPLLPLFLTELGGGVRTIGVIEGAADALGAAAKVLAGRLSDRGPRRLLVIGGYAVPAAARACIALALVPWHVLGARLADRLGKGIRSGPRDALLADAAPSGEVGRAFGLQRSMDHLGAALGPLIAAGLLAAGASLRVTFAVAAAAVPLLWFLHHLVKTFAGLPGGALSDRVPRGMVVAAGWGAYALAYVGFAFADSPVQVAGLFVFYALYHGLAEGAERALIADLAPEGVRGRAFGWYHGVVGAAALPAGLLTGALWEAYGAHVALGTCAALAGAAAVLLSASPLARRS